MTPATSRLPELVEGDDLVLRRWTVGDVDEMADLVTENLEHLRPFMAWIAFEPLTRAARISLEREWEQRWLSGGDVTMAIVSKDSGAIIGSTGLHRRRGPRTLEIGYWVDRRHVGRGVATSAASMLTTTAFGVPAITTVEIHHDKANLASRRVPEKLGYEYCGETEDTVSAPGEVGIDCRWEMTRERWEATRR